MPSHVRADCLWPQELPLLCPAGLGVHLYTHRGNADGRTTRNTDRASQDDRGAESEDAMNG